MKLRIAFVFAIATILLTACNFTLAADVTPPPGYIPPTPMPTLGPLFPPSAPDVENGAAIYTEKCAACHGDTGLGDGSEGKQLPVTVAAFALPETAQKAAPARWYTTVTQGNLERFMPPFTSLSDQERWDVISYALTLHTSAEQIETGKTIFQANCVDCAAKFQDQKKMAALSADELVNLIRSGNGDIPAFGTDLSDEDAYAVAAYLRTLTFASPQPTPTTAPVTQTPVSADAGTPSAVETPLGGTPQVEGPTEATVTAGVGTVSGKVDNQTGKALPSNLKVTLRGYDHGGDPSAGPQEVLTLEGVVESNGSYKFENIEIPESRIFLTEVGQGGVTYQSDYVIVEANATNVTLPDVILFGTTTEFTNLVVDNVSIHFNYSTTENIQVLLVYSMRNTGKETIVFNLDATKQEIPFIKAPANASELGFQETQDSAAFRGSEDGSTVYMFPTEQTYGLIVFTDLPAGRKFEFSQEFVLSVASVNILMPEGVTISGDAFSDDGLTPLQGQNGQTVNFHAYSTGSLNAGETLTFTVSGKPKSSSITTADLTQNQNLWIGVGIFGLVLILAGVWMYLRDRNRIVDDDEEDDDEFEDSESVLDAIIALDDLHRAGKLNDEAYHKRRDELKAKLKEEI